MNRSIFESIRPPKLSEIKSRNPLCYLWVRPTGSAPDGTRYARVWVFSPDRPHNRETGRGAIYSTNVIDDLPGVYIAGVKVFAEEE